MDRVDAIYARQSVDKADSISIESQIDFCKYETRGEPFDIYFDKGYSGKNIDRPQFQKMLTAVRAGTIKRVICYKLDRCSRSILDFTKLMELFQHHGVEFISCTEKFDTSTPMGRAMLNICIVFAQLERETIQQRITDAYHARCKRGFYMGGRIPFGFRLEQHILEDKKTSRYQTDAEEAKILLQMYHVYAQPSTSLADVVLFLQQNHIPNPRRKDGQWVRSHIGRMLRNPIYVQADQSVYDHYKAIHVTIHNDPVDFIGINGCYLYNDSDGMQLVLAPHKGIVPAEIWLRCIRKGKKNRSVASKAPNTWLAGKIRCARCGYALVVRKYQSRTDTEYRYLYCSHSVGADRSCQGVRGLRAEMLESLIAKEIDRFALNLHYNDRPELLQNHKHPSALLNMPIQKTLNALMGDLSRYDLHSKMRILDAFIEQIFVDSACITIRWKL